jgi:hypothetical protein
MIVMREMLNAKQTPVRSFVNRVKRLLFSSRLLKRELAHSRIPGSITT